MAPQTQRIEAPYVEILTHLAKLPAFAVSLARNRTDADDLVRDSLLRDWPFPGGPIPGRNLRTRMLALLRNVFHWVPGGGKSGMPDPDGVLALCNFLVAYDCQSPLHREGLMLVRALGFPYDEPDPTDPASVTGVPGGARDSRPNSGELHGLDEGVSMLSPSVILPSVLPDHAQTLAP